MKHGLYCTLGLLLLLLGMVAFGAVPTHAATANGPYYATPSWDQQLQCDTTDTCPRFIMLSNWGNAAVLDRETGLVWERSPSTSTFNWRAAQDRCNALTVGNRKGWRLPTIQELASLIDPTQSNPALPSGHPFTNVQSALYWSATTSALYSSQAWFVDFRIANVFTNEKISSYLANADLFVWCVRGGQGVDPQ